MTSQQPPERAHGSDLEPPAGSAGATRTQNLDAQVALTLPPSAAGTSDWFHSLDFSPSGAQLATGRGTTAHIWDLATGRPTHALEHPQEVWTVRFSPDGRLLATGCKHETVRLCPAYPAAP